MSPMNSVLKNVLNSLYSYLFLLEKMHTEVRRSDYSGMDPDDHHGGGWGVSIRLVRPKTTPLEGAGIHVRELEMLCGTLPRRWGGFPLPPSGKERSWGSVWEKIESCRSRL